MKIWKLVPVLFVIGAVGFSVPTVKSVITGESLNVAFLVIALSFFTLAIVFFIVGRKAGGGSGVPNA
jgi:hypothetical protein